MNIQFKKIHHVQICIPFGSEKKAKYFYGNVLGLKEIEKPDSLKNRPGFWYEIANIQLHIGFEDSSFISKEHPAFEVNNISEIKEYLIDNNIKVRDEIKLKNINRFSFFDPFDNRFELMEFY